ncbi:hypothetical protein ACH4M4_29030 [Streptomyces sp. NPDC017254]|uniref:effector-associated constant component EACC1 n=1 Tax=unclassified Streptomyces TaxID=2593676 RepID=UPI0037A0FE95
MRIRIMSDGDESALTELQSWLADTPGTSDLPVEPVTGDGPTMSVLEAIDIVLGQLTDTAAFALAYATWRSTRNGGSGTDPATDTAPETGGPTAGDGARTLTHGATTVDIGHLAPDELAALLHRLNGGDQQEQDGPAA